MKSIQLKIYKILDGSVHERAARYCEVFIAAVVVLNVVAIILESVHELHEAYEVYFHAFDVVSVMIFSIEYVLRVWTYGVKYTKEEGGAWRGRKEYLFSFYGLDRFFWNAAVLSPIIVPWAGFTLFTLVPVTANFQALSL